MFRAVAEPASVPVTLHLDHCPDREVITDLPGDGLELGALRRLGPARRREHAARPSRWSPRRRRHAPTSRARSRALRGVEDDIGSDEEGEIHPLEEAVAFLETTGVDCFAPGIGTAHGVYAPAPELIPQRVTELVAIRRVEVPAER